MRAIVSDTTTLIILGKIDRFDLLENLFFRVYIPTSVESEILVKDDEVIFRLNKSRIFEIKKTKNLSLIKILDGVLDKGEIEAIALAKELDLILLIDEKKGRTIAKNIGLDIIGLIGILILNVKKSFISKKEAIEILEKIKGLKFRVSLSLEKSFLEAINF